MEPSEENYLKISMNGCSELSARMSWIKDIKAPAIIQSKSQKIVLKGLRIAIISDFSVAYKLGLYIPVLILSFMFRQWIDITLVLLDAGMMMTAEFFNSTIKILYDLVELSENTRLQRLVSVSSFGL